MRPRAWMRIGRGRLMFGRRDIVLVRFEMFGFGVDIMAQNFE